MVTALRVLIADPHDLIRDGLRELLVHRAGFEVVGAVGSLAEVVAVCRDLAPDVLVIDPMPAGRDGIEFVTEIARDQPLTRVIVLTSRPDDAYMLDAIRAGVRAYLFKSIGADGLIDAVKAVHRGLYLIDPVLAARVMGELHQHATDTPARSPLRADDINLLRLVAEGLDNREIAARLGCSQHTVSNHMRSIFVKLRVANRTQAVVYAMRRGWIELDERPV